MESTHCFGQFENMLGVYCEPTQGNSNSTAVIMLTPGMLHHVGPMRLHVQLARQLAEQGVASLRFDLSGIGESLAVASQGTSLERARREVGEAMGWLKSRFGFEQFVLFGLCSGADDALATAVHDERVVGVAMIDGCAYRTSRFYRHVLLRKYLPKLLSIRKLQTKLISLLRSRTTANSMPSGVDIREYPEQQIAEQQLRALQARGVRMQFLYTGGAIDNYSYREQFFDMFPTLVQRELASCKATRDSQISVEYLPEADHLVMLQSDRVLLLNKLVSWIARQASRPKQSQCRSGNPQVEASCV